MNTILEVWRIEPMSLTLFQFIPVTLLSYQCNILTCELKTEYQNWLFYRGKRLPTDRQTNSNFINIDNLLM